MTSTLNWRAADGAADAEERVNYLERVSRMPLLRAVAASSLNCLRVMPSQSVLEVGCGSGVFLPRLAEAVGPFGQVTGIDAVAALVDAARVHVRQCPAVTVHEANAYDLPFDDAAFDAAHCERVLMHLEHPDRALQEMRRVVKPGGWIVAAEPDWGGLQIASADAEAMSQLIASWTGHLEHPRMGLQLLGLFADAQLLERSIEPIVSAVTDYQELVTYGLDLPRAAADLGAAGVLSAERSQAVLDECTSASAEGRFFGYIGVFVVSGRVPPPGKVTA
jgi:ubiquinone/menaquinone biosynthesis C-methylase UbiE